MDSQTPSDPSTVAIIRRIVRLGWSYKWLFLITIAVSAGAAAILGYLPVALEELFSAWSVIQNKESLPADEIAAAREQMNRTALITAILIIPAAVMGYGTMYAGQRLAHTVIKDLRLDFVVHLVALDLSFHSEAEKGDLMTRMMDDLNRLRAMVQRIYSRAIQKPLVVLSVTLYMFIINVYLGIFLLAALIPLCLFLIYIVGKIKRKSRDARTALASNVVAFEQIVSGIRVIKAMGSAEREAQRFSATNDLLFNRLMGVARSRSISEAITAGTIFAMISAFLFLGNWLFGVESITPSQMISALGAIGLLTSEVRALQHALGDLIQNTPAAERVFEILDRRPSIADRPNTPACPAPQQAIQLDNVSFRYGNGDDVLRNISLSIPVGQTVALVGPSGGGKSTLLDLIPRLHDVTGGKICWDGADIRDYQPSSIIGHCAIVQQDAFLFDDTIYENIAYGRPQASRTEIEQAARRASVHDDILRLEGGLGYDTRVGDRGSRLSGGQRQRIAIARALLRDAPVLLLDEPTSALDATSEGHVQSALAELMAGRTTVMIAHRLATIRHADQIYVLGGKDNGSQQGKILESGTHDELIAKGGLYAELVAKQDLS